MNQISHRLNALKKKGWTVLLALAALSGCAKIPNFIEIPGDKKEPGALQGLDCNSLSRSQTISLTPEGVPGGNLVFLLDETLPRDQWERLQTEISNLAAFLKSIPNHKYKMVLIFDERNISSLYGSTNGYGGLNEATRNPFSDIIDNKVVFHIRDHVGQHFADAAFFYAFAQPESFKQNLKNLNVLDQPGDQIQTDAVFSFVQTDSYASRMLNIEGTTEHYTSTIETFDRCQGSSGVGRYYRPRAYLPESYSTSGPAGYGATHIPSCLFAENGRGRKIEEYFSKNVPLNVISMSRDDLDVNFDSAGYDPNDAYKRSYPETTLQMFQEVASSLGKGASVKYNAFVSMRDEISGGYVGSPAFARWVLKRVGSRHLALAQQTQGLIASIDSNSYIANLKKISDEVIFDSEDLNLACSVDESKVRVLVDGREISSDQFEVQAADKKIKLLPGAFKRNQNGKLISVEVVY